MSDPKFTPGPWKVIKRMSFGGLAVYARCLHICEMPGSSERKRDRLNANLISAAPDLYEVLKAMEWSGCGKCDSLLTGKCPVCGGAKEKTLTNLENIGHAPDCKLAAALKKAEGKL